MTDFPDVKIKALVTFPATVIAGTGVGIERDGGTFTFDLDYSELTPVTSISAAVAATTFLVVWESSSNSFRRISLTNLKTTLASLP